MSSRKEGEKMDEMQLDIPALVGYIVIISVVPPDPSRRSYR
jgi:hypothetical protein